MKKLHLCCGDVYLKGYTNIDIVGYKILTKEEQEYVQSFAFFGDKEMIKKLNLNSLALPVGVFDYNESDSMSAYNPIVAIRRKDYVELSEGNINETTLDNYFKYPFIQDPAERNKNKRPFIIDMQMDILKPWPFEDNSIEEIVMISCIEHFDPKHELPHILKEINRVMKSGGKLIIDFPDIKKQVEIYMDKEPEFCYELIYCNHKHKYAIHHWGFNEKTFPNWLGNNWDYKFFKTEEFIIKHDYPMIGCFAYKK